jgi:hypothetical protein
VAARTSSGGGQPRRRNISGTPRVSGVPYEFQVLAPFCTLGAIGCPD